MESFRSRPLLGRVRRRWWYPPSLWWLPDFSFSFLEHGVTKSRARLSDFTFTFHFHALEKEMATNPLQCSCLENPRDGGAWWAAVYGVAQSWT